MTTPGTLGWIDLTVDDAQGLRDFYASAVGWAVTPVGMDGYEDYAVGPEGEDAVAGVCHRRGSNASMPTGWVPYFSVDDALTRGDAVVAGGGRILQTRDMGSYGTMVVCEDPAGHTFALIGPGSATGAGPSED